MTVGLEIPQLLNRPAADLLAADEVRVLTHALLGG